MDPERWRQIETLFYPTSEMEETQRGAFLDQRCAGDTRLRADDSYAKTAVSNTTTWGTPRAKATELIEDALNGRTPALLQ